MKPLVGPVLGALLLVATALSAIAQPLNLNVKKAAPAADKACFTTKDGKVICLAVGPTGGGGTGGGGSGGSGDIVVPGFGTGTGAGVVGGHSAYNPPPTLRDIRKDLDRYISERRELPS